MTAAQHIEYQITRQLVKRRGTTKIQPRVDISAWTDRLIAVLALAAGLLVLGSYVEEVLWFVVAATTVLTLR